MKQMSALDLYFLSKEFQSLTNGKVEKVYQFEEDFIIRFFCFGEKKALRIDLKQGICYFTQKKFTAPRFPPSYCTFLRKYLTSAKVLKVYQKDFDRVLVIDFSSKLGELSLIVEFFGEGNILVAKKEEENLMVIHPFKRQKLKDRSIQSKSEYIFPSPQTNLFELTYEDLLKLISGSQKDVVRFLASDLGLGGDYAEEICSKLKVSKTDSLDKLNSKKLFSLLEDIKALDSKGFVAEGKFTCLNFKKEKAREFNSLSEAIDSTIDFAKVEKETQKEEKKSKDKLQKIVDMQSKRVEDLLKEAEDNKKIGEFIYEKYSEFDLLLRKANELLKTKSIKEVEELLLQNSKIKSIDKKNKKINLEF